MIKSLISKTISFIIRLRKMCMKNERNTFMKKLTLIMVIVLAVTTCFSFAAMAGEKSKENGINWGDDNFQANITFSPVKSSLESYPSQKEASYTIPADGYMYFKLEIYGADKISNSALDFVEFKTYDGATSSDITNLQYLNKNEEWVNGSDLVGEGLGYIFSSNKNDANHKVFVRAKFNKNGRYSIKGKTVMSNFGKESIVRYINIHDDMFMVTQKDAYLLENYKSSAPYIAPAKDGQIFAGWYNNEACTQVNENTSGVAFAKFVDANMLSVKAQSDNDAGPTAIRFVSSLDSLDYDTAGFIINGTYGENTITNKEKTVSKVYQKIIAGSEEMLPSVFSDVSNYFFTYTVRNLDSSIGSTWKIKPFVVTPDGTKVIGKEGNFTFPNNGQ